MNESNIIVNPKNREVSVIDLDSAKIGTNKVFPARYLCQSDLLTLTPNKYQKNPNAVEKEGSYYNFTEGLYIPSSNTDLYCYTIMVLNYLYGSSISKLSVEEYYEYMNYLESIGINKELIAIFLNIVNNGDNINPINYLETLTSKNVYRSREKIFKANKKR